MKSHIAWLDKQISTLDDDLGKRLRTSDAWKAQDDLLRGIARLVRVAPLANGSGKRRGKRFAWGGQADVRAVLYMATVSAIRCSPAIKAFADRLKQAGKPAKVVIVACMRKPRTIMKPWSRTTPLGT